MRIAVLPGSYDPMTLGHRDIVIRALAMYDEVYVAIMHNPDKKGRFTFEQRLKIAELTLQGTGAHIAARDGLTVDFAKEVNATALVKGIRNSTDFEYEKAGEEFNREHFPECQTVYLRADEKYAEISSTEAYRRLVAGESTENFLDSKAAEYMRSIIK